MTRLFSTVAILFIAGNAMSQAITLSSSPTVKLTGIDSCGIPSSLTTLPSVAPAINGSWDFGSVSLQAQPFTYQYRVATPGFPSASFGDSISYSISASAGISVKVWRNITQGSSAVSVAGEEVLTRQAKSLSAITFGSIDSFVIPSQVIAFSTPLPIIKFPATMSSAWGATTPRVVNFNITVAAMMLNNAPGQIREILSGIDSVVGWGRMKVPVMAKSKASGWINVLQVRHKVIAIDSFYLNGSPASATFTAPLGLTQGQRTVTTSTYFYRAAAFRPLFEGQHIDSNFSTSLSRVYLHTTDLPDATGISGVSIGGVHVYPNPLHDRALHIEMATNARPDWRYSLINIAGQQVGEGPLPLDAGLHTATLSVPQGLAAGIYYLKLERAAEEPFIVPLEIE